jgi:hypothetical protein
VVRGAVVAAVNVLLWWGLLFVLYVVLISSVSPLELMVGAGFALLGAAAAEALRRAEHPRPAVGARIASAAAAFPLTLLRETGMLAGAVVAALTGRQDHGRTVTVRLAPGTGAAPAAALLSASPGACVIDITAPGEGADTAGGGPGEGADGAGRDGGREAGRGGPARSESTPATGHDLTVHLLGDDISLVERALGGRRLT